MESNVESDFGSEDVPKLAHQRVQIALYRISALGADRKGLSLGLRTSASLGRFFIAQLTCNVFTSLIKCQNPEKAFCTVLQGTKGSIFGYLVDVPTSIPAVIRVNF